jgi:hypothetical protein
LFAKLPPMQALHEFIDIVQPKAMFVCGANEMMWIMKNAAFARKVRTCRAHRTRTRLLVLLLEQYCSIEHRLRCCSTVRMHRTLPLLICFFALQYSIRAAVEIWYRRWTSMKFVLANKKDDVLLTGIYLGL